MHDVDDGGLTSLRLYLWARVVLLAGDDTDTEQRHLLIRRNDTTGEHAYLRCYTPDAPGAPGRPPGGRGRAAPAYPRNLSEPPKA